MGLARITPCQRQELPARFRPATNEHLVHDNVGQQVAQPRQVSRLSRDENPVPIIFEKFAEKVQELLAVVDQEDMGVVIVSGYDRTFRMGTSRLARVLLDICAHTARQIRQNFFRVVAGSPEVQ